MWQCMAGDNDKASFVDSITQKISRIYGHCNTKVNIHYTFNCLLFLKVVSVHIIYEFKEKVW